MYTSNCDCKNKETITNSYYENGLWYIEGKCSKCSWIFYIRGSKSPMKINTESKVNVGRI